MTYEADKETAMENLARRIIWVAFSQEHMRYLETKEEIGFV